MSERSGGCDESEFRSLILGYFPGELVSTKGQKERYQRGKTAHTIFTWWARRPFAAARGMLLAAALKEGTTVAEVERRFLEIEAGESSEVARGLRVLDPFGGGGTFGLEAARMGAEVVSVDNNELAVFVQKGLLQSSQIRGMAAYVERYGKVLIEALREETKAFYPARQGEKWRDSIAYLWTTEVGCPGCGARLSLMRRPWLARRKGRRIFVERWWSKEGQRYETAIREEGEPGKGNSAWEGRSVRCPGCGRKVEHEEVRGLLEESGRDEMVAMCSTEGRYSGDPKRYWEANEVNGWPGDEVLEAAIQADLKAMGEEMPMAELPEWSGVTNPTLYGRGAHRELFNLRQRALLVRLARLLREFYPVWEEEIGEEAARGVLVFLSGFVDQLVDWNSRLSTWISQNEQVGRGLSGPGMAMVWDYVEIDPLEEGPANLCDKLERIVTGLKEIGDFAEVPEVVRGDARDLRAVVADESIDVVVTDPPYFDNLFYSVLADCIYVWKRLAVGPYFGELFEGATTDQRRELTMNRHVHADKEEARAYYQEGMAKALGEMRRVLKPGGVLAMVFAHSTIDGWAAMVGAFRAARVEMVRAWPMYVERNSRPRGHKSRAVNTSFVLVGRRCGEACCREEAERWEAFWGRLQPLFEESEALMGEEDYGPLTHGRTFFGRAVAMYSQVGRVVEDGEVLSDEEVVERISRFVDERLGVDAFGIRRG